MDFAAVLTIVSSASANLEVFMLLWFLGSAPLWGFGLGFGIARPWVTAAGDEVWIPSFSFSPELELLPILARETLAFRLSLLADGVPGVAGVRPPEEGVLLVPGVPGVLDLPGVPGVLPGVLDDPLWFRPLRCPALR